MKNGLTNRIDHLNFEDGEMSHSTQIIYATRSIVANSIYIGGIKLY
jgi:hypothetical protein